MIYQQFVQHLQKAANIEAAIAVLHWDKEVNLPVKGAAGRGQVIATLAGMLHEIATDDQLGEWIGTLKKDDALSADQLKNVQVVSKDYDKGKKLDTEFIIRKSKAESASYHAWLAAREKNDFELFKPALTKMIDIKKEEVEKLGFEDHPYDTLLDAFEPQAKTAELVALFEDIKAQLTTLTAKIRAKAQVENDFLFQHYPSQKQWDLGLDLLKNIGYDLEKGRQDKSPHPFTITFNPHDVRVTTVVDENNLETMTWSCLHEGGHALYEQGLNIEYFGLPLGRSTSLGIHESQSRLWENNVGRSKNYWIAHYQQLQNTFPDQLGAVSLDVFYRGINKIQPSLIRIESDELHYHLHILIRFELEKALMEEKLKVADLKEAWNAKYKAYLDVDVPNDNKGILQDIHWAHGSIGYFPTYSLGSLYAAQFYHQATKELPNLEEEIRQGNNQPLLDWLRENIHQHGRKYTAKELCEKVCGEPLNAKYFMDYAKKKFGEIYKI